MTPLEQFGITLDQVHQHLMKQKAAFLVKQGWTEMHLARFDLQFCPNKALSETEPLWNSNLHGQLGGYNYIAISFKGFQGEIDQRYVFEAGKPIPFLRIRKLDFPEGEDGKYTQYPDSGLAVYKPHDKQNPKYWDAIVGDITKPICLTEGEFDSINGYLQGLSCLGLTGLDCFMSYAASAPAWPANGIIWTGRRVPIIPDQDPESTYEEPFKMTGDGGGVKGGAQRLVNHLLMLGAIPSYYYIARTRIGRSHKGEKIGLTEYFKYGGTIAELAATERKAKASEDDELLWMLQHFGMFRGKVFNLKSSQSYEYNDFVKDHAGKKHFTLNDKGKLVAIAITKLWLEHKYRVLLNELIFRPDLEPGLQPCRRIYNMFYGFEIAPAPALDLTTEFALKVIAEFEKLSERLWREIWPTTRGHYAWMFQKPEILRQHIPLLQSRVTGIGKSAFFKLLCKIIGDRHSADTTVKDFLADFNVAYSALILVFFDEVHEVHPKSNELIKRQCTTNRIIISQKYKDKLQLPWYGSFCGATNEEFAFRFGPDDRRQLQSTPAITGAEKPAWQSWVWKALPLLETPEALAVIHAYFRKEEWLKDYDPKKDAVRTNSFEVSIDAAASQKEANANLLFDFLPDLFCIDSVTAAGDDDLNKYIFDTVKARAESLVYKGDVAGRPEGVLTKYYVQGRSKSAGVDRREWYVIYSKKSNLDFTIDSQGKTILKMETNKAAFVQKILGDTKLAITAFKQRAYTLVEIVIED